MDPTRKRRVPRIATLSLVGLLLALAPPCTSAQSVRVVVTERDTRAPLPGVYVTLTSDEDGTARSAGLTDEAGRLVLRGESGIAYRLRAERVGMASAVTEPFTMREDVVVRRIALAERAIQLEGLTVTTPVRLCEIDAAEALTVQRLWNEIRKALQSAAFVHANELDRFRFERFQREWTRDLRGLRAERYFAVEDSAPRPFLSQDARTLSERGFVQGEVGDRQFFAPDAAVLLSEPFLRDHRFGLEQRGEGASPNVRISVEPVEGREVVEIAGTLEIDTLTLELRSFDFEYVNLPDDIPSRDLRPDARVLDAVVRGYVSDATTGSALAASRVSLVDAEGDTVASASAGPSGQFRLVLPRAGRFVVTASSDGYGLQRSDTLSVAEGEVLDLLFEMSPASALRRIHGRVLDALSGRPVAYAGVHLLDAVTGGESRAVLRLPRASGGAARGGEAPRPGESDGDATVAVRAGLARRPVRVHQRRPPRHQRGGLGPPDRPGHEPLRTALRRRSAGAERAHRRDRHVHHRRGDDASGPGENVHPRLRLDVSNEAVSRLQASGRGPIASRKRRDQSASEYRR